jgi:hypothetical protein
MTVALSISIILKAGLSVLTLINDSQTLFPTFGIAVYLSDRLVSQFLEP